MVNTPPTSRRRRSRFEQLPADRRPRRGNRRRAARSIRSMRCASRCAWAQACRAKKCSTVLRRNGAGMRSNVSANVCAISIPIMCARSPPTRCASRRMPGISRRSGSGARLPIEVIAGREEARLIYAGAAHSVPASAGKRLVVDIGGGSTEFIIGSHYTPIQMESLYIGCVSHSRQFFRRATSTNTRCARPSSPPRARSRSFRPNTSRRAGTQAIGSSGTARALAELVEANGFNDPRHHAWHSRGGLER